jgi:hypothetical protein
MACVEKMGSFCGVRAASGAGEHSDILCSSFSLTALLCFVVEELGTFPELCRGTTGMQRNNLALA